MFDMWVKFTSFFDFYSMTIFFQRNLTEYYNACGVEIMYGVFAAMLKERRIIITSNKLPKLSACVQVWSGFFIFFTIFFDNNMIHESTI